MRYPTRESIQTTLRRYPGALWLLALANFVLFTARGMTVPFWMIFFGQVVGLGEGLVGAGLAVNAIAGIIFTFIAAGLIDRLGPRVMLIATILGTAVMSASFPLATTPLIFFVVMILHGCANQLYWPSSDTFATSLVPVSRAGEMFAMLRVANALGIGAGGLLGGLMVTGGGLTQYRLLYLSSAAGIGLAALMILVAVRAPRGGQAPRHAAASATGGSWREVLADRRFVFSQLVMFILLAAFTQTQISMPPYLRAQAHIDEAVIGLLFTINTLIVIATQIPVAARIASWGRGTTFAIAAIFWAVSYALFGASPWLTVLPFAAIVIYTVGEMLFMPTSGVLVVELAPEHLRGRYLSASSIIWGGAWGLSSWASGAILGSAHPGLLWPALIAVFLLGGVGGWLFDRTGRPREALAPVAAIDAD